MKLTLEKAREMLEEARKKSTDDRWINHSICVGNTAGKIAEKGYTLVPLKVYIKGDLIKVEIGLARGKKLYDKRQDIAKKDQRREVEREFKVKNLY